MTDYSDFRAFVRTVLDTNDLSTFKTNNSLCAILEHKHCPWGVQFYEQIRNQTTVTDEELLDFCKKNDAIGSPQLQQYSFGTVSSNSIKYVYHANLSCKHIQSLGLTTVDLVEIGGGYGGMAFAMTQFAPQYGITIRSYTMLDFPELCELQKKYLESVGVDTSIFTFHSTFTFGNEIPHKNMYILAIYSLGELEVGLKQQYIETLFPKVDHGFIIWNAPPLLPFHKQERITPEVPLTGQHNTFIYF